MTLESPSAFLTTSLMQGGDWRGLELAVARLLLHSGWSHIQTVGGSGDKGADILAVRQSARSSHHETYVFQVKATTSASYIGRSAVDQALQGQAHYKAAVAIVVTNGEFTKSAYRRRDELNNNGYDIRLWNGRFLLDLIQRCSEYSQMRSQLRVYQKSIVDQVIDGFNAGHERALFIVATGLGKTVIAAALANRLFTMGLKRILVLCHSVDLALQLERAFWNQLSKAIPTRTFMGGAPPSSSEGVSFGLYQTMFGYLGGIDATAYDLVIVDEAHHALANAFTTTIEHLHPKLLIGMTATPWRGDGLSIESIFGAPVAKVSLVDGMRMGFLAKVDYRLMCDNINWDVIPTLTESALTIRDLNRRLFLPQRDNAVIAQIRSVVSEIGRPKLLVFSPSIEHASTFAAHLVSAGIPAANLSVPDKQVRQQRLLDFASGRLSALTAVDVLNEGIDLPDVNMLVFLRATHSRRIFVQQLGRGLRISPGKDKVVVLDFVSDLRRIAAVRELEAEAKGPVSAGMIESVYIRDGVVTFSDKRAQKFVDAWLDDVTSLQDYGDSQKLTFPDNWGM